MRCVRSSSVVWVAGLLACNSPSAAPPPSSCNASALVALSNYSASGLGNFSLDGGGYLAFGADLYLDPALETSGGRAFYIARDVGKLYELDASCGIPTGAVFDANRDAGSVDPQDVAVGPDGSLWVPLYTVPSIIAFGPNGAISHTIDISSYDPDGNPNATAIAIAQVNGAAKAFVALEVLDDDTTGLPKPYPKNPSLILPIDIATGAVETPIALQGRNPFGFFVPFGGALWMAEPGDFSTSNEPAAGIERFDPQTSTSQLIVRESDLGGSVAQVAITAGCGAAIIADSSTKNLTSLVTFDPVSGAVFTTAAKPAFGPTSDYDLQAMLWVGNTLMVGDRTQTANTNPYAVHVFDLSAPCTLHERTDSIYLPMQPVAFQAPLH